MHRPRAPQQSLQFTRTRKIFVHSVGPLVVGVDRQDAFEGLSLPLHVVAAAPEIGEFEPRVDMFGVRLDGPPHTGEGTIGPQRVSLEQPREFEQFIRSRVERTGSFEELDREIELVVLDEFVGAFEVGFDQLLARLRVNRRLFAVSIGLRSSSRI